MLVRQKVLIELIRGAERAVSGIELMKWCFLLRNETRSAGGASFFDFLAYHYGPYSFGLQRELQGLVDLGFIEEGETGLTLTAAGKGCEGPPQAVAQDAKSIVRRHALLSTDALLENVYARYPHFTILSRRKRFADRPVARPAVYTAGYEGRQIDGFLWLLMSAGVSRLIDVRNNPVARRYGFHKSTISRLCQLLGIEYVHTPELGISSTERRLSETSGGREHLLAEYATGTLTNQRAAVTRVASLMTEAPSVLVCLEAVACQCHRSRLATAVSEVTGLPTRHLGAENGNGAPG